MSLEDEYLHNKLIEEVHGSYMKLKLFIDSDDEELKQKYAEYIKDRRSKMLSDIEHIDAGFDLLCPSEQRLYAANVQKVDYQIICSAQIKGANNSSYNTGFYMYPRSSISKSHIRLANNTGIIDAGYRGHLMAMFDVVYNDCTTLHKFDRHLQICAPNLIPIIVELVNSREELGEKTARGDGGFGSTGV
jgi:dUTP pyrophosphatase